MAGKSDWCWKWLERTTGLMGTLWDGRGSASFLHAGKVNKEGKIEDTLEMG